MGNIARTTIIGFLAGLLGAYTFYIFQEKTTEPIQPEFKPISLTTTDNFQSASTTATPAVASADVTDFSVAAAKAIPSVVYINSISQSGASYSYWDQLFGGGGQQPQVSSGSGVIFTSDGYIVTNNHVVESAERIQVIYNKKVYDAELVGTDPSTDLGVLKIQDTNLPAITLGSSKTLAVGEWVVAVGNPFSLSSTVTAGIVSAKGRRINIVEDKFPIESFIQTDAAINPGNSGGALVNRNGELVGINTAILSRTGSYTGYAFAVPIDIAKKVVNDLIKYGLVQKALLGGNVIDYDYSTAATYNLPTVKDFKGVVLAEVEKKGVAVSSGLKLGDVIIKIDNTNINSKSEFEEELSYHYPGDKINVTFIRDGKVATVPVSLVNKYGDANLMRRKIVTDEALGIDLEAVDYGVKVSRIKDGLFRRLGIPENYTIISINRERIKDPQDVSDFFKKYRGRVLLYGINAAKQEMPLQFLLQ
ncbi:MAG TPA: trypsin-like peptidase domain-containing protein [Cyclobacteriaceae bacterium]|nr:trypsin-like peptidase domain-containing protein [Cyclobacteriaceae bacterium]